MVDFATQIEKKELIFLVDETGLQRLVYGQQQKSS